VFGVLMFDVLMFDVLVFWCFGVLVFWCLFGITQKNEILIIHISISNTQHICECLKTKYTMTSVVSTPTTPIFRFKIEPSVVEAINGFAKIHQFDDRRDYKEAWKQWCEENRDMLEVEVKRLEMYGYTGDAYDKFFKSGRYYFRNKKVTKTEPVERKKYVGLSRELLKIMDDFICNDTRVDADAVADADADANANPDGNGVSPAAMFDMFCQKNQTILSAEITTLLNEHNMTNTEISAKLKKTFKNRYFQKVRKV
jgi:hypothetical protein